jgi:DNA-directed DNA polymerase III PolC
MPVSLHTHSGYSLLEGASGLDALLERARAGGHTALALTDTNNLCGSVAFVELAERAGVRPLLGACLRRGGEHCVVLIASPAGYRSLCRLLTRLNLAEAGEAPSEGSLTDLLCAHSDGLHVLADDPSLAERLRDAFGRRLWLELIRPRPAPHEAGLRACARRLGLRLVASTAAHFAEPADWHAFRLLTAIRRRTLLDRLPAESAVTPEHHLAPVEEWQRRFRDVPQALRNGEELAEQLRSDVLPRQLILPEPRRPRGLDSVPYLRALCERGLREREVAGDLRARTRLREELGLIEEAGLAGYFLTVRDIARWARRREHTMALRGSAGNSLVCYLLGITDVDPIRFGLEPARFLHAGRVDLPDIDLDFDWKVRDAVIDHVIARHGRDHVARISAHLFFQPRSAFREAGKAHGLSDEQVSGLLTTLDERLDDLLLERPGETPPLPAAFPLEPARWPRLVGDARLLLGRPHGLSLHPGGVVLTPQPVEDYVSLQWAAKGVRMTQLDKDGVERVGLVKIDLLGNRALATVDEARRLAGDSTSTAAEEDAATVALLQRGDTLGITQLESPAMRHLVLQMQPERVEDVVQALALLRPGAASIGVKERFIRRRRGLEPVRVAHPALAELLGETHGLMLYEDDGLRVLRGLTGLPSVEADRFRKRISKHRTEEEAEGLRREFEALCARRGVAAAAVAELWEQLAKFNRYSFCKSHAVSYGLIAWQAARLKAHHPVAFWVAALNNNQGAYPRRVYVEAVKRAGIEVLPPCVNASEGPFTKEANAIRIGMDTVAGLPQALRETVVQERARGGPYRDLADVRARLRPGPEALAALVRSGALGFTGRTRPELELLAAGQALARSASEGRAGELFSLDPTEGWRPPDDPPLRKLRDQWQAFGFVLGPPLFSLFPHASADGRPPLVASAELARHAGQLVRVQGLVATARNVVTEDGRPLQFVTLEDEVGLSEVTLFDGTCPQVPYLTIGPYVAAGVVEERHGAVTLTAREFRRVG